MWHLNQNSDIDFSHDTRTLKLYALTCNVNGDFTWSNQVNQGCAFCFPHSWQGKKIIKCTNIKAVRIWKVYGVLRDAAELSWVKVSNDFTMTSTTRICYGREGDGERLVHTDRQRMYKMKEPTSSQMFAACFLFVNLYHKYWNILSPSPNCQVHC